MKKRLIAAAGGLAMLGAAAVPASSAFGTSPQGRALRCQVLLAHVQELHQAYLTTSDLDERAFIAQLETRYRNRYLNRGCNPADLPSFP